MRKRNKYFAKKRNSDRFFVFLNFAIFSKNLKTYFFLRLVKIKGGQHVRFHHKYSCVLKFRFAMTRTHNFSYFHQSLHYKSSHSHNMNFQTTLIKFSASFCFKFGFGREKKKKNTRKRSIQFIPSEYHSEISTEIEHFKEMSYIVKEVFKYYCCTTS